MGNALCKCDDKGIETTTNPVMPESLTKKKMTLRSDDSMSKLHILGKVQQPGTGSTPKETEVPKTATETMAASPSVDDEEKFNLERAEKKDSPTNAKGSDTPQEKGSP